MPDQLSFPHARARPRFLVRIRLSSVSGSVMQIGRARRTLAFGCAGVPPPPARSSRPRAGTPWPTSTGQGPQHVARPGAAVRRPRPAVPAPIRFRNRASRRAGRAGGPRAGVGRAFTARLSRRVRRRRRIDDPATIGGISRASMSTPGDCWRRRSDGCKARLAAADRRGRAAWRVRRAELHRPTANCSGATIGSNARWSQTKRGS